MTGARRAWLRRILSGLAALAALLVALVVADAWRTLGRRAQGVRRARMEASPQWRNGRFVNPQPLRNDNLGAFWGMFKRSAYVRPQHPVVLATLFIRRKLH